MRRWPIAFSIVGLLTTGVLHTEAQSQAGGTGTEDCVPYNAATLQLIDEVPAGWIISRDDGARLIGLDTKADADIIMAVFKSQKLFCYVGRDNRRPDRQRFVHHYWK